MLEDHHDSSVATVNAADRLDRTAAILLRMALLAAHPTFFRDALSPSNAGSRGPASHVPAEIRTASREELSRRVALDLYRDEAHAQPAVLLLNMMYPADGQLSRRDFDAAYRMADSMARQARQQSADADFEAAHAAAKSAVSNFFAWLMPARA